LGNDINGAEAERMTYQINVPANAPNASITYRYAVVFQDPGHQPWEQPRFVARVLDVQTNTYLPCASYEYIATSAIPGFYNSPINDSIKCKDWASVYINLSKYQGRSLILEFTTADCTRGGHWGYAYIDVGECDIAATVQYRCNPNQVVVQAPPGFQGYKWYNGNYSTVLGTDSSLTINQPPAGLNALHVVVTPYNGFGCGDTLHVSYNSTFPVADAGPDKPLCPGTYTIIGSAAVGGNTYTWTPRNFLSDSSAAMPSANPPVNTTYTLSVFNANTGCTARDSMVVTVNAKPTVSFNAPAPQCLAGNSFTFTNNSTISAGSLTYQWDFGDGTTSTQVNPAHTYAAAGIYHVKLVATSNNGCKDSLINNAITVNGNPVVKTNDDLSICRGASIQLQTTGAQSYTWSPTQDLSCTNCANPVANPATTSTYIVKGLDNFGCPGFDTVHITVNQPIQVDVSPDITICQKQVINLQATGAVTYDWSPATGLSSTIIPDPVATPQSTTTYRVIGFDGKNCFTDTSFVTITVNPTPQIDLGPDLTLSTGTIYPITSVYQNGPIVWWQWTPATDLSCANCPDPSATVNKDITYHVAIRNSYGCTAIDSVSIRTFCEGSQVFIPNAFTPDGDGVNDILMVRAKGISSVKSFRIFNRWGELVFERKNFQPNDPANGWDGKIRGVTGPAEVYVYTAEVICSNLQTYLIKGNTSILK
jgi:gliding motility-associated-like protein